MWLLSSTQMDINGATCFKKKKNAQFMSQKSCYLPFQDVEKHTFDILLYVIVTYKLKAFYSL